MDQIGTTGSHEKCITFVGEDAADGPDFKIYPNGSWGPDVFPATYVFTHG